MKTNNIKTYDHFRDLTKMVLILFAIIVFAGCKPQQILTERVVKVTDSTLISKLNDEIYSKEVRIGVLESDLKRSVEENIRLLNEVSSHVINYDTGAQINPQTGKYPIANETITETKSSLEKTVKEYEQQVTEQKDSLQTLSTYKRELESEVNTLKKENKDLKEKATVDSGLNLRLFLFGLFLGAIITFIARYFIKNKLK